MAPKRKQPTGSSSKTATTPAKRRSKLAKDNDLSADEESEIQEAFALFSFQSFSSKESLIATSDVRRALIALNTPPTSQDELTEIISTVDPDDSGSVSYEHFVAVAALKLRAKHDDPEAMSEEVMKAYQLFTKGQEREINLNDLRRVARELREEVPDNVLKDMLREATGGGVGTVGVEEFEGVMKRAGVFG
ncbi:uncharacterized protein LTR77_007170 [Saxophila tyrrhenica]|uniref:Calmodulin n=1 Tax=Saxophila tyrrhenica TaxID=1690608 RepID=A0AAV9P3Z1_9PEZI|nr:hypothetical protein LTR77_007170 [Saxophila tyrrhenica]